MPKEKSVELALHECKEIMLADVRAAIDCLQEILNLNNDSHSLIEALYELGRAQTRIAQLSAADKSFSRLLEFSNRSLLDEGIIKAYLGLASVEVKRGNAIKAIDFASKALLLSETIGFTQGVAKSHHYLAVGKSDAGDNPEAEKHIEHAIFLWQEMESDPELAESLNAAGSIVEAKGDRYAALATFNRALSLFESMGNRRQMAMVLNNIAVTKKRLGAYEQAIEIYERALDLAREVSDSLLTAIVLSNYAELLRDQGEYETSRFCLEDALRIQKTAGDLLGIALTLGDIGYLTYLRGDVQGAIFFFRESLRIYERSGSHIGLVYRMHEFSRVLVDFGLLSEAKEILEKGEELANRHQSVAEAAWINLSWGYYEKAQDNIGRARQRLTRVWESARRISDPETVVLATILLAEIEIERGFSLSDKEALERAHAYISEGKKIAQESGRFVNFVDSLLVESLLLGAQFKFDEALEKVREAKNISGRMQLAQIEHSNVLESILSERRDLAESQKIVAMLRARSTRDLLDFMDIIARRRPMEELLRPDQIYFLATKVDSPGPMLLYADELPFSRDSSALSLSLGVFIATAIGQGSAHRSGLYGPLPALDIIDHETLVYTASIPDRTQADPRMKGLRYCIFFLVFPADMRRLFWNRPALIKVFEEHLQVSDISEIDTRRCISIKKELVNQLGIQ
ncbi:MAG: tetratricopeptide repeat protein [Candidatus Thorarchaeota archaeon]